MILFVIYFFVLASAVAAIFLIPYFATKKGSTDQQPLLIRPPLLDQLHNALPPIIPSPAPVDKLKELNADDLITLPPTKVEKDEQIVSSRQVTTRNLEASGGAVVKVAVPEIKKESLNRTTPLYYPAIFDEVHHKMSGGWSTVGGDKVKQMQETGLPRVIGYKLCPQVVRSVGPWVGFQGGKTEMVPAINDLNKLANLCDQKNDCLAFNAYLKDGYLHTKRDGKSEKLTRAGQRWVPIYIKETNFKSCQPGTVFF